MLLAVFLGVVWLALILVLIIATFLYNLFISLKRGIKIHFHIQEHMREI